MFLTIEHGAELLYKLGINHPKMDWMLPICLGSAQLVSVEIGAFMNRLSAMSFFLNVKIKIKRSSKEDQEDEHEDEDEDHGQDLGEYSPMPARPPHGLCLQ